MRDILQDQGQVIQQQGRLLYSPARACTGNLLVEITGVAAQKDAEQGDYAKRSLFSPSIHISCHRAKLSKYQANSSRPSINFSTTGQRR